MHLQVWGTGQVGMSSRNGDSHQPRPFIFTGRLFTLCGLVKSRTLALNLLEAVCLKGNTVLLRTVFISGYRNKGDWEGWFFPTVLSVIS